MNKNVFFIENISFILRPFRMIYSVTCSTYGFGVSNCRLNSEKFQKIQFLTWINRFLNENNNNDSYPTLTLTLTGYPNFPNLPKPVDSIHLKCNFRDLYWYWLFSFKISKIIFKNSRIHLKLLFLWFPLINDNLTLKIEIWKFLSKWNPAHCNLRL